MAATGVLRVPLQFFDAGVTLRTDVEAVAAMCTGLFGRFVVDRAAPSAVLEIVSEGPRAWRVRDPLLDARVEVRSWLEDIAAARILEIAGNEVTDHDLFHAAALSRAGRGVILAAESGFGKSTLTLALLRRGWRFLSDEVAALDRHGVLHPFPKALELRPGAALLPEASDEAPRRGDKTIHDPETIVPGCLSAACRPVAVIFLESAGCRHDPPPELLRLVLHREDPGLAEAIRRLEGVLDVGAGAPAGERPSLIVRRDPRRFEAWRLDVLLGRHGVLLLSASSDPRPPVDFDGAPVLAPLGADEGVARLLARFRGRQALARRAGSGTAGYGIFFLSLLDRLAGVKFHTLRVGRLEAMLDRVEQAVP